MENQKLNQTINLGEQGLIQYNKKQYKICKNKCLKACQDLQSLLQAAKSIFFFQKDDNRKQIIKQFIVKYLKCVQNVDAMQKSRVLFNRQNINNENYYFRSSNNANELSQNFHINNTNIIHNNKDQYIKQVEESMIKLDHYIHFNDIIGLEQVKKQLKDAIINPSLRPDLYKGVRTPYRAILFYGPPGNGKTMLAKALAAESNSTFFNISASSLFSKCVGDSQKKIKALFVTAYNKQPSIIFIKEIELILTEINVDENQVSSRLKTQFLIKLDNMATDKVQVLIIGATNFPNLLDNVALKRFNKNILIDKPDLIAKKSMITKYLKNVIFQLSDDDITQIAIKLQMHSANDIRNIIKDAAMMPIRQLQYQDILEINQNDIRPIIKEDFKDAIKNNPPTFSKKQYKKYKQFGIDKIKQKKVKNTNILQQNNQLILVDIIDKNKVIGKQQERYRANEFVREIFQINQQQNRSLFNKKHHKAKTNFSSLPKSQVASIVQQSDVKHLDKTQNINQKKLSQNLSEKNLIKNENSEAWYKSGFNFIRRKLIRDG